MGGFVTLGWEDIKNFGINFPLKIQRAIPSAMELPEGIRIGYGGLKVFLQPSGSVRLGEEF